MLKNILTLLKEMDAYNVSEEVEIAKGKYHFPLTSKEMFAKIIRDIKFRKK